MPHLKLSRDLPYLVDGVETLELVCHQGMVVIIGFEVVVVVGVVVVDLTVVVVLKVVVVVLAVVGLLICAVEAPP